MKQFLSAAAIVIMLAFGLWGTSQQAMASSIGITGWSGASGNDCSTCHTGGEGSTAPLVVVTGDATVSPSSTVMYMLAITSTSPATQTVAGWNMRVVDANTDVVGTIGGFDNTVSRLEGGELTHVLPQMNDANGLVAVNFDWTAPATPGTYTIFVAANSANNNSANGPGDATGLTTFEITVAEELQVGLVENSAESFPPYLWLALTLLIPLTAARLRKRS